MELRRSCGYAERNRFGRIGRIPLPTPFPVGDVNAYLVFPAMRSESLTLIDTGVKSPEAFEALQHGFKEFGWALEQVDRILITHAHLDHYGQARRLRERCRAAVYAPRHEAERMQAGWASTLERTDSILAWLHRWGVPEAIARLDGGMAELARRLQDPVEVDVLLEDGDTVRAGDLVLEVIATPGHCDGHVVYYERSLRILFSGDHLLTDISPVPLLVLPEGLDEPRPKSLVRFMESLKRVEKLECELTLPSHGDAITDHRQLIEGYRLHHQRRALQLLRHLRKGPLTPFELAVRLFPHHYSTQIFLVMSEVIGHLDVLIEEGSGGVERARMVDAALGGA
jgi:glyoxylase-like metal-dependent hydrolase (beta-lactamase superfamily II)